VERINRRWWVALGIALLRVVMVRGQPVTGDVTAVGFRASTTSGAGQVARAGQWVPIQVQLRVQGSQLFQGGLRVELPDLDGDLVSYVETPVTVTPDAGLKRAWCYAVWARDPFGTGPSPTLEVFDADGRPVTQLPLPAVDIIGNDALLVLDASARPLTRLRTLETPGWLPLERGFGTRPYYRNILIATLPAAELPDRWLGLEAVDVLVWDEPNPASLSIAQLKALREWVRAGGQLVVGLGASWPAVQKSELAELLPVQSPGTAAAQTLEVQQLEQFFQQFVEDTYQRDRETGERTFTTPITIAAVEAKPGALRAVRALVAGGRVIDLVTMQTVGSGRVTAVAAGLHDLLQVPVNDAFYAQLFDLNPTTAKFRESEGGVLQLAVALNPRTLYDDLMEAVSFKAWSSVLVLAAFAFVVVYIGLATAGSWWWLRQHSLTPLSWTVFALFAVAGSTVSLATVGVLRGVSRGVKVVSLVDLEAGSRAATSRCYFGYSSPSRVPIDLSLAGEGGFLRPLARGPAGASTYATPQRYTALCGKAALERVPRRATLKQFEGVCQAELSGSVRADLVADRQTGQITPGSWIQNDLDFRVLGGYLLYVDPRFRDDDYPTRAAGKTTNYWKRASVPPGINVLAVALPPIQAGGRISQVGQPQFEAVRQAQMRWLRLADRKRTQMPDLPTLWHQQQWWVGAASPPYGPPAAGLDPTLRAALLASTRTYYLNCQDDFEKATGRPITTEGLMNTDVSHWLMQGLVKAPAGQRSDALVGQAVLLLIVDHPGPGRLYGNGKALGLAEGVSLYRLRVPIGFEGRPPAELPGELTP